jgi:hypothetical protein
MAVEEERGAIFTKRRADILKWQAVEEALAQNVNLAEWVDKTVPKEERHTPAFVSTLTMAVVHFVHLNEPPT